MLVILRIEENDHAGHRNPSPGQIQAPPLEQRQARVWRVRLLPDGTATKVGVFVQLSGGLAGPDGLALNDEDGLAIAHAGYGVVWICNRLGDPVIAVRSPEGIYKGQ
jgi:hypothetical protein